MTKVLDLFSGAGGFSYGFREAGFNVVGAVEWDKDAYTTHQHNFPHSQDILGDITQITDDEVLTKYQGVDVIIGGPPCQGFSNANRTNIYSEEAQQKNKLFLEFLRFVRLLQPTIAVMENVPAILTRDNGATIEAIHTLYKDMGYQVTERVLLASDYGVPENRKRTIIVAVKEPYDIFNHDWIQKKPLVTVKEALSDLYEQPEGIDGDYHSEPQSDYQQLMRQHSHTVTNHTAKKHSHEKLLRIQSVPQGKNWKSIPKEYYFKRKFGKNTHSSQYHRLDESKPSTTVTSKIEQIHPLLDREITVREGARIQSFPDHFEFKGPQTKQQLQVGNAVPPLMAQAIAETLITYYFS